jgi:hypothetical protein
LEPPFLLGEEFSGCCRVKFRRVRIQLAMAAAVASAAVEPTATTVEPGTAAVETIAATEAAVAAAETIMAVKTATSIVAVAVIAATTVEAAAVVTAVEPWAGADEDAADEVVRSVIAVGSASIGIVAVVTVGAGRGGADGTVNRAYPNAETNLRVGAARGKKQNSQQCNIF